MGTAQGAASLLEFADVQLQRATELREFAAVSKTNADLRAAHASEICDLVIAESQHSSPERRCSESSTSNSRAAAGLSAVPAGFPAVSARLPVHAGLRAHAVGHRNNETFDVADWGGGDMPCGDDRVRCGNDRVTRSYSGIGYTAAGASAYAAVGASVFAAAVGDSSYFGNELIGAGMSPYTCGGEDLSTPADCFAAGVSSFCL